VQHARVGAERELRAAEQRRRASERGRAGEVEAGLGRAGRGNLRSRPDGIRAPQQDDVAPARRECACDLGVRRPAARASAASAHASEPASAAMNGAFASNGNRRPLSVSTRRRNESAS
jgi:hypothetical protein